MAIDGHTARSIDGCVVRTSIVALDALVATCGVERAHGGNASARDAAAAALKIYNRSLDEAFRYRARTSIICRRRATVFAVDGAAAACSATTSCVHNNNNNNNNYIYNRPKRISRSDTSRRNKPNSRKPAALTGGHIR